MNLLEAYDLAGVRDALLPKLLGIARRSLNED